MDPRRVKSDSLQPKLLETKSDNTKTKTAMPKSSKVSSSLLADINFERKNKRQPRLPPGHIIQKRPILHPPVAALYAGPNVQKVVYVSKNTPIMAAVKRVKKLLEQAEKRNLQREGVLGSGRRGGNNVALAQKKGVMIEEVVLVKGSGRAMEQAAKVGEWFKRHAEDGDGGWVVNVKASSVKVIDDILELSSIEKDRTRKREDQVDSIVEEMHEAVISIQSGLIPAREGVAEESTGNEKNLLHDENCVPGPAESAKGRHKQGRRKRKRPIYDEDDVPEARTRFINAIEIAVSLRG